MRELPPIQIDADISRAWSIPALFYTDPEVGARERDRIFARTWQVVGHHEQLLKAGDFFTTELLGEPLLLVLDEPNSNLDAEGEQALIAAITAAKAKGAIVIVIAHRQSIMDCVDKLLVLQDGRIAQFGERTPTSNAVQPLRRPPSDVAVKRASAGAAS